MAYIDSSLDSHPAGPSDNPTASEIFDPLNDEDGLEDEPRKPDERPPAHSLLEALIDQVDDINLARYIDDQTLDTIGQQCLREYEIDSNSRKDWEDKARKAMKFAMQKTEPKTYPWPGASNTIYPLITQACLDFHSRITGAVLPGKEIVKGTVWGTDDGTPITLDGKPGGPPKMTTPAPGQPPQPEWLIAPGEKRARADRVGEHMSWQLLVEMKEWVPQTDALLLEADIISLIRVINHQDFA